MCNWNGTGSLQGLLFVAAASCVLSGACRPGAGAGDVVALTRVGTGADAAANTGAPGEIRGVAEDRTPIPAADVASGQGAGAGPVPAASELRYGMYVVLSGAPEPLACSSDADCTTGARLDVDGCCLASPPSPRPMTRAYADWTASRMSSADCSAVECPPLPQPSPPICPPEPPPDCCFRDSCEGGWSAEGCPCCDFHVRCIDGWCRNGCTRDWQANVPEVDAG